MTATIAQIENAILARLKAFADAGVLGYTWGTLESYPVDWDEYFKEKTQWKSPAAWVSFLGWGQSDSLGPGTVRMAASFGLVVAAANKRNETAQRSEARRGGQEGVSTCRSRGPPYHEKNKKPKPNIT